MTTSRVEGGNLKDGHVESDKHEASKIESSEIEVSRFQALANAMPQIVFITGADGAIRFLNQRWYQFVGDREEYSRQNMHDFIHPDDVAKVREAWELAEEKQVSFASEMRLLSKSGEYRWFMCRAEPVFEDGNLKEWFGTSTDIHEQKKAAADLIAREELYRNVISTLTEGLIIAEASGRIIEMNEEALRIHGFATIEDMILEVGDYQDRFKLESIDGVLLSPSQWPVNRAFRGERFQGFEVKVTTPQRSFLASYSGAPIRSGTGVITGTVLVIKDITSLYQAQQRIIESERKLDQIFNESFSSLTLMVGPDFVYEKANRRFYEESGLQNVIGRSAKDVYKTLKVGRFLPLLEETYKTGQPFIGQEVEVSYRDASGKDNTAFVDYIVQPLRDEGGKVYGIVSQVIDVTEKVESRKVVESSRRAIANERENFRNLFKQTPEMVCILRGPNHVFEFVNEAHIKALGFDATGMAVREAQPESVEVHGILDGVYRTGQTAFLHEIPVTLTDRLRYFNLTYAARWDENGQVNGVMILGAEITDQVMARRQVIESAERMRFALQAAKMGAYEIDLGADVFLPSNKTEEILGCSELEGSVRKAFEKVAHPDDFDGLMHAMEDAIRNRRPYVHEFRVRRTAAGHEAWVLSQGEARYDGSGAPTHFYGVVQDITGLKRSQIELQEAAQRAEEANKLKSAFLANMSHEIRTPLGAMIGFADLLRERSLSSDEQSNYVEIMARNGEQLSALINDILDLSKIEAGHMVLDYGMTNGNAIASDIVSLLEIKAREKGVALRYDSDPSTPLKIVADPLRLRQILINLIGNAIKFTDSGEVRVRSFGTEADGKKRLCYEVSDTGIGIPLSARERIFQVFEQADGGLARRFGGTGLGLALSRQLAKALGGDVRLLESTEGKGSKFLIEIADQAEMISSTHAQPSEEALDQSLLEARKEEELEKLKLSHLSRAKILIVDDSPDNQHLIGVYLSKYGAVIDSAENGRIGYQKALAGDYDLVLMDIQMPDMDGYTATAKLRAAGFKKPIVALTAHALTGVRAKCLNVGCNDHLSKPIKRSELIAKVTQLIRS